jgi:hypothetical protein
MKGCLYCCNEAAEETNLGKIDEKTTGFGGYSYWAKEITEILTLD